ncbi:MAG: hypothetical protein JWM34_3177 [Ilumatobacteraceae bacterium]|nr:hypothetical protein [Ilumatobacteraceae bacterium]
MSDLDRFTALRPDVIDPAPDVMARLRADLFGTHLDGADEPEPERACSTFRVDAGLSKRRARPRAAAVVAAAAAAVLLVTGLAVIGLQRGTVIGSSGASRTPPPSATTAPADTTDVSATPTSDVAAGDPSLPPGVALPAEVPVLEPAPAGDSPVRSDPIDRWVHGDEFAPDPAWFIRRDAAGDAIGGIRIETAGPLELTKSPDAPSADLPGVDARIVGGSIGWATPDGHTRFVVGIGNVSFDELTVIAASVAAEGAGPFDAPSGFDLVSQPTEIVTTSYDTAHIGLTLLHDLAGGSAAARDYAFMSSGPGSTLDPLDGGYVVRSQESSLAVKALADGELLTVFAPSPTDVESLLSSITFAPTPSVPVRRLGYQLPANATWRFGEIALGRWAVATFVDPDGRDCVALTLAGGGPTTCSPPGSDCPVVSAGGTVGEPTTFVVLIRREVHDVHVTIDGEPAPATLEASNGYTFAYGTTTMVPLHMAFTVDGEPTCGGG